jgi:hypothetical protein
MMQNKALVWLRSLDGVWVVWVVWVGHQTSGYTEYSVMHDYMEVGSLLFFIRLSTSFCPKYNGIEDTRVKTPSSFLVSSFTITPK